MGKRLIRKDSITMTGINVSGTFGTNGWRKQETKKKNTNAWLYSVYHERTSQQIPVWVSPYSLGSYSFFIYLQLSAVVPADKRLQLSGERPMPQPGLHLMIMKCMIKYGVQHSIPWRYTTASTQKALENSPSHLACNFHSDKYAHSAFQKAFPTLQMELTLPSLN